MVLNQGGCVRALIVLAVIAALTGKAWASDLPRNSKELENWGMTRTVDSHGRTFQFFTQQVGDKFFEIRCRISNSCTKGIYGCALFPCSYTSNTSPAYPPKSVNNTPSRPPSDGMTVKFVPAKQASEAKLAQAVSAVAPKIDLMKEVLSSPTDWAIPSPPPKPDLNFGNYKAMVALMDFVPNEGKSECSVSEKEINTRLGKISAIEVDKLVHMAIFTTYEKEVFSCPVNADNQDCETAVENRDRLGECLDRKKCSYHFQDPKKVKIARPPPCD